MEWSIRLTAALSFRCVARDLRSRHRLTRVYCDSHFFHTKTRNSPHRIACGAGTTLDISGPIQASGKEDLPPMKRWVCASLLIVLVSGIGGWTVAAQTLCYPVTPGDTAARIAERLTGDPRNQQAPWFEIVDERWRRVSK